MTMQGNQRSHGDEFYRARIVVSQVTVTLDELAKILGIEPKTLRNRRNRIRSGDETLPPPLEIKGQRELVWLMEDVLRWLRERSPYSRGDRLI